MTSVASYQTNEAPETSEDESSQASTIRSRLSHSSRYDESVGSSSKTSSVSMFNTSGAVSATSQSSRRSRTSVSSPYSRDSHPQRHPESSGKLSTIHSLASASSSTASCEHSSHASSSRAELSLPSSFGGSAYRNSSCALVKQEDGVVSVATQDIVSIKSDEGEDSINSDMQLALRVEKETKPMMHLVKLLKEMDMDGEDTKNDAITSLISEFEDEVTSIEQRIVNPMICNGEDDGEGSANEGMKQLMQELPPNWIALEDPDSGDIYYSNEITGEVTWDRPELEPTQITDKNSYNESEKPDNSQDFQDTIEDELPPNWVALEDPDSGDLYYVNEITGESTWDRPFVSEENMQVLEDQQTQKPPQGSVERNDDSFNCNNEPDNYNEYEENDNSLPNDWIPLIDPSSGDTYYCNEVTGETTWDRPEFEEEEEEEGPHIDMKSSQEEEKENETISQPQESVDDRGKDVIPAPTPVEDEDLPAGWFSIVDPDSGDVYYSNEVTGETTWDKPFNHSSRNAVDNNHYHTSNNPLNHHGDSNNSQSTNDGLPPDWISIIDPDSGSEYYFNEVTQETTWDKPVISQRNIDEQQKPLQQQAQGTSDFPRLESTSEWFPVVDPQSGDTYYANERTGETSWEKPDALLYLENVPHNDMNAEDETRLLTNYPNNDSNNLLPDWFVATDPRSGDEYYVNEVTGETSWDRPTTTHDITSNQPAFDDENSLASGWFAVVEPQSGDVYYAHEQTGETSWEKPPSRESFGRNNSQHNQSAHGLSKMSLSMHENTVYENDSVTSSQY